MLLYIMRHGETDYNVERRMQGWIDTPLNANGRKLAEVTGEGLKEIPFDLVITSPLQRAVETARLAVGGRDIPFILEPRLKEVGNGEWEGYGPDEIKKYGIDKEYEKIRTDPMNYKGGPGGETVRQVIKRTGEFLEELIHTPDYQDFTILISTHGGAMRALLNSLYEDKNDFWHGGVPLNCAVNIVRAENGKAELLEEDKIYYDPSFIVNHYANYTDGAK